MITLNNSNINFDSEDTSDESKYTITLSNKSSNFIFKTSAIERLKIMNDGNIGVGLFDTLKPPLSKLHIRDNYAKLIIQDSRVVTYGDIDVQIRNNIKLLPIELGIDKNEKYVKFTYNGDDLFETGQKISKYYFTTTTELEVDILIVGGGGAGGDEYGGGGGAGGVVYVKNQRLAAGRYVAYVGNGGLGLPSSSDGTVGGTISISQNGSPSEIKSIVEPESQEVNLLIGGIRMFAYGGGAGGTSSRNDTENGRAGGSSGGSSGSPLDSYNQNNVASKLQGLTYWDGSAYVAGGKIGRQNPGIVNSNLIVGGGGGGIGSEGNNSTNGNNGVEIKILNTSEFYAAGGGAGIHATTAYTINDLETKGLGGSGIGGNGRIYNGTIYSRKATSGKPNTGSGGGGSAWQVIESSDIENAGSGGSGVIIIRYRPLESTSASIELIRNISYSNDNNTDYKIGNYDGTFKIISSTLNTETDRNRLIIDKNGDITIDRSINASSYLLNGQPFSIEEAKINTSNYVLSTSNILIDYIKTNNNNVSSQWINGNSEYIYYDIGNVGIGTTNPLYNLQIYNKNSAKTNLTIQNEINMDIPANIILPPRLRVRFTPIDGDAIGLAATELVGSRDYDRAYKAYALKIYETQQNYMIETNEQYIVDILIVGGGGGAAGATAGQGGGAGGAGGIVYIVGKKLNAGKYYITVGDGGAADNNGENSSIKYYNNNIVGNIITIDGIPLLGKGGGKGRNSTETDADPIGIGSGGGGYYLSTHSSTEVKKLGINPNQGDTFWNKSTSSYTAGGFKGENATATTGGNGGGFGDDFTVQLLLYSMGGEYKPSFCNGGKIVGNKDVNGISSSGNGGSRNHTMAAYGKGGSGFVFIKYKKIPIASSSINLSIGNEIEKDLTYSISNTNNSLKINLGSSEMMVINSDGNANFNGNLTAKSYIVEGGINILKDTSNYITTTSNIITNYINNRKSSQWDDNPNLTDIYYNVGKVGIGVINPVSRLTINNIITGFDHSIAPLTITNQTLPIIVTETTFSTPIDVLHLCRVGIGTTGTLNTGMRASLKLGKWTALEDNSRTRLDIALANGLYNAESINVMTILSNGRVGIGKTNPTTALDVNGTITATSFAGSIDITSSTISGTLPVTKGGTGVTSFIEGGILFASSTTALSSGTQLYWDATNNNLGIGTNSFNNNSSRLNINPNIESTPAFVYRPAPLTITNEIVTSTINSTSDVLHLCRVGGSRASFRLSKWEYSSTGSINNARTRLDIALANDAYSAESPNVLTILSNGKIGIGTIGSLNSKSSVLNLNNNIIVGDATSYNYSDAPLTITNQNVISLTEIDPKNVLHLCRVGNTIGATNGVRASFKLDRWEINGNNSRTRLDIALANNIYSEESPTIMTFLSNGRVGIGITNPAAALHVQQTIRIGNSDATLEFGNDTTTQIVRNGTTSELRFRTNSANRLVIDSSGNVGIGITNPLQKLHVVGEIYTTGEITAFYSDERLKTKISTINNPLSIVNKLHGFYYIPNEIANKYGINKNKIEIGLSAQDVQKVLPELVKLAPFDVITNDAGEIISKSGEKYLTISYERLVPVLVEAIKELEIKNNSLNEKYENILQEISLIKKKINLNIEWSNYVSFILN